MQQTIKELTPILNDTITSILGTERVIAHHDIELNKFTMTEHAFLFPSSFNRIEKCIHFTPEFVDHEDDFSFFDKEVENYLKNIIRLIRQSGTFLIFSYRLNIIFDELSKEPAEISQLSNTIKPRSFRLIVKLYQLDGTYYTAYSQSYQKFNKLYEENPLVNRFVIFGKIENENIVIIDKPKLFEKINFIKENILLQFTELLIHDLDFDLSKKPEEFEKELLVIEMSRI